MAVNRYSDISVSGYNPLSLQEIMLVPQQQRLRHDQAEQAMFQMQSELAKVNPLDVHLNEANSLRSSINDKIYAQAEELSRNGVNTNILSTIKRTNRDLIDLMSPTGRLGQINNAKQVYQQQFDNYLKDAVENKKWSRELAISNWNRNALNYTGYDTVNNIKNIDPYGSPNKVNLMDKLKDYKSILGEQVVSEIQNNGYSFAQGPNGSLILVDRSGNRVVTSNQPNINQAMKLLESELAPGTEWYKSSQFEGINPDYVKAQGITGLNAMLTNDVKDNRNINASLHGYKAPEVVGSPSAITESVNTVTANIPDTKAISNLNSAISNIPAQGSPVIGEKTLNQYLNANQKKRYTDTVNSMKAQGQLPKDANPYAPYVIDRVSKDWQRLDKINTSNQIIVPSSADNDMLASPNLKGKDINEKNGFIRRRISVGMNDKQKILYDAEGKPVDLEDIDLKTVQLNGHYSPMNVLPKIGGNPDNTVSPHSITWLDKDGDTHTGYLLRDKAETKSSQYRAATVINKTYNRTIANEGRFITFTSSELPEIKSAGLDKMRVKYDHSSNSYTVEAIKNGKVIEKSQPYSAEEYQNVMYNLIK